MSRRRPSPHQRKLIVNRPEDVHEREADHISEQVMRIPGPSLQSASHVGTVSPESHTEQPGDEHERVQTKNKSVERPRAY